ncbi:MAG TPA: NADH-quinone oxidoreductase subunit N [Methylomirabilota bacterium]|nr:NADH-quinone oxidoreductase subunit N [Methylomirabilota bacterium]
MNYAEIFRALQAESALVLLALVVLAVDLLAPRTASMHTRWRNGILVMAIGCITAFICLSRAPEQLSLLGGMLSYGRTASVIKQVIVILTFITAVISMNSRFTKHIGEYLALMLLATVGMMLLGSSDNLLLIFVALELTSLPLYVLTAFNKSSVQSSEAGLKYFLFGSMSAAFTLFGLSLLYGISGEITLSGIAAKLGGQLDPIFYVALVMTVIGFAFKIAVAPFHLWAPDVYQGAPTPVAAFIASGSKVASFFVLARIMMAGFAGTEGSAAWRDVLPGWVPLLAALAIASMVLGNVAAIAQSSVKRLLAYSAIAHAGYALLAVLANTPQGFGSLLYYVVTYAVTALGAFAVVGVVENSSEGDSLSHFAGLSRRSPVLSLCMLVFVLSLAGIPPLAGFFGKFYVFTAAARAGAPLGLLWLVIIAIATSAISLYYYLQVLKQIYVSEGPVTIIPIPISLPVRLSILALAVAVVLLGCAPDFLLQKFLLN